MPTIIKPTVGRKVWYRPNGLDINYAQPHDATIVFVHSDTCVNLALHDSEGAPYRLTSVRLVQDGEERPSYGNFAEWMPYQTKVAASEQNKALNGDKDASYTAIAREIVHQSNQ